MKPKNIILKELVIFIFLVAACPFYGQGLQKMQLTEKDYDLWSHVEAGGISPNGAWISYTLRYDQTADTLFVKSTAKEKLLVFPEGTSGSFHGNTFAFINGGGAVCLLNLANGRTDIVADTSYYEWIEKDLFVTYSEQMALGIHRVSGGQLVQEKNVVSYSISPDRRLVLYIVKRQDAYDLVLYTISTGNKEIVYTDTEKLGNLAWQKNGAAIAFQSAGDGRKLHYYDLKNNFHTSFMPEQFSNFPASHKLHSGIKTKISDDGTTIFFGIIPAADKSHSASKPIVEVWDSDDKRIYPQEQQFSGGRGRLFCGWSPMMNKFKVFNTADTPSISLSGNQSHVVSSNPLAYAPNFQDYADVDYYLTDVEKGTRELLIKRIPEDYRLLGVSPDGRYLSYFKEHQWHLYSFDSKTHRQLTAPAGVDWDSTDYKYFRRPEVHGNPGWSSDGKYIILYDEFDIFAFPVDGGNYRQLTKGQDKGIIFRIDESSYIGTNRDNYDGGAPIAFDLKKGLVLTARSILTKASGYYLWTESKKERPLAFGNSYIGQLHVATDGTMLFCEQTYEKSPELFIQKKGRKSTAVFKSNPQQDRFYWGRVELVHFKNKRGQDLSGLLYYPANYQTGKKYPMVVNIYSQISGLKFHYVNPSKYSGEGFNLTNYVTNGYFVLLPDIKYVVGETGMSALDCVTSAVESVLSNGIVDEKKVGLIGHSFGGYETAFIVTQSNLFAAAVAGAAATDLVNWNFSVSKNTFKAESWRMESQQWRMGAMFYDNKETYLKNSPIMFADKVETPLLSWAGKMETNIPWEQSVVFYNALRRMGKKNVMLLYPTEDHSMTDWKCKEDLSRRIKDWFDGYLK